THLCLAQIFRFRSVCVLISAELEALSGIKTPPMESQKPIVCYLWITIGILLLRSVVLGVLLSVLFQRSPEKETFSCQPQNTTNRLCLPKSPEEKGVAPPYPPYPLFTGPVTSNSPGRPPSSKPSK
ncbi:hypothetical protein lerEdw1_011911, partial [Lerista edwardsae]